MGASRYLFNDSALPGIDVQFDRVSGGGYGTSFPLTRPSWNAATKVGALSSAVKYEGSKSFQLTASGAGQYPVEFSSDMTVAGFPTTVYLDYILKVPSTASDVTLASLYGWHSDGRAEIFAGLSLISTKQIAVGSYMSGWNYYNPDFTSSAFSAFQFDGSWVRVVANTYAGRESWSTVNIYQGGDIFRNSSPTITQSLPGLAYPAISGFQVYWADAPDSQPHNIDDLIISDSPIGARSAGSAALLSAGMVKY